jgi:thiamine biosynthesis lipoprotein
MGTRLDLVMIDTDDSKADSIMASVSNILADLVGMLSIFEYDSELSVVNRGAAEKEIVVSEKLFSILTYCKELFEITGGVFDISSTRLTTLWRENPDPSEKDIQWICDRTGMDKVYLNSSSRSVRFENPVLMLDSGAFGKGIALREIRDLLLKEGVSNALVSFGESSVAGLGTHPHGPYWPVGLSSLFDPRNYVRVFEIKDSTLSTSGSGFLNSTGGFESYRNIINPKTGMPILEPASVSVMCEDPFLAEILSTALLIDSGLAGQLRQRYPGVEAARVYYDVAKQPLVSELFA